MKIKNKYKSNVLKKLKMENYKKSMNIENAINRLQWRFKNENVKPNESKIIINDLDIQSVDFLIKWIDQQKKETLKENVLFAKMYCYCLFNELEFYKDIKFSTNKLNDELIKPIEQHYLKIAEKLNKTELESFCKSVGIETDHFKRIQLKQTGKESENEKQKEIIKLNKSKLEKFILGIWSVDSVFKALNNTITELINKHKNKK